MLSNTINEGIKEGYMITTNLVNVSINIKALFSRREQGIIEHLTFKIKAILFKCIGVFTKTPGDLYNFVMEFKPNALSTYVVFLTSYLIFKIINYTLLSLRLGDQMTF
jgi:hypothetical protein